ncbi:NACHT domain-containing protein [Chloroflexi bacterium TSY]|nr:NACHT domain-containing protein [Chloroflexi bacterium TSY]
MTCLPHINLSTITITAAIEPTGRLRPVAGLWEKVKAVAREAAETGLLRLIIVAQDQSDVPRELLQPDAWPLRVIQVATVQQAVAFLYQEHGSRAAIRTNEHQQSASLNILGNAVPIEEHYQILSLLHEVKKEQLPNDPHASGADEDGETGLRLLDLVRWEETVRDEYVTNEAVSLEQIFTGFQTVVKQAPSSVPRFVVLGPPGSGKTTLAQYLARLTTNDELRVSGHQLIPARVRLRDWEVWATKRHELMSLPVYLAERYRDLNPAPTATHWRDWLQRGDVLLLFDGLDEINDHSSSFRETLKRAFANFTACPMMLTCRTVSFRQHQALCPEFPVFTLGGLDDSQRNLYIQHYPAHYPDRFKPNDLIDQLNHTPQLVPLAANPLILAIICYVVDDPRGIELPATRGQLYDKAVDKLLARFRGVDVSRTTAPLIRKRRILEHASLILFAGVEQQRHLTFDEEILVDALSAGTQVEGLSNPIDVADALLEEFVHNSGILQGNNESGYFFLHLTLQEYLAASALACPGTGGEQAGLADTDRNRRPRGSPI